jgi:hypothetical protein
MVGTRRLETTTEKIYNGDSLVKMIQINHVGCRTLTAITYFCHSFANGVLFDGISHHFATRLSTMELCRPYWRPDRRDARWLAGTLRVRSAALARCAIRMAGRGRCAPLQRRRSSRRGWLPSTPCVRPSTISSQVCTSTRSQAAFSRLKRSPGSGCRSGGGFGSVRWRA